MLFHKMRYPVFLAEVNRIGKNKIIEICIFIADNSNQEFAQ